MKRHPLALAGAAALWLGSPWFVPSRTGAPPRPVLPADDRPLAPAPAVDIAGVLAREPFRLAPADTADDGATLPADAADPDAPPRIVGIVGRLPDQAVVLVARPSGGTRTLAVGEAIGRWRLVSVAADAVLFTDGARRVRVELPAGEMPQG